MQFENTLNNWHSEMGKAGHHALIEFWEADTVIGYLAKACTAYVAEALSGLHFIYKYPDACVSVTTSQSSV